MGDSFQVHVFGDPGMEMMPECSGCMCYNHGKICGFREVSLFLLFLFFFTGLFIQAQLSIEEENKIEAIKIFKL